MYGFYLQIIVHAVGALMIELKRNPQTAAQLRNWLSGYAALANVSQEVKLFLAMMLSESNDLTPKPPQSTGG